MTAKGQNFEMFQGDTLQIYVVVTDVNDVPMDITNYDASFVMYSPTSKDIVLQKTTASGGGITKSVPESGVMLIDFSSNDTKTIIPRSYNHELEIANTIAGTNWTVAVGIANVLYSRL